MISIVKMFYSIKNKHPIERFSAHILRHTFVSILIAEDVAFTKVAKIGDTPEMVRNQKLLEFFHL